MLARNEEIFFEPVAEDIAERHTDRLMDALEWALNRQLRGHRINLRASIVGCQNELADEISKELWRAAH